MDYQHLDSDDSDTEPSTAPVPLITDLDSVPDGASYHVVTMVDGSRFSNESPFKIHRWIKSNIDDVEYAKPLRSGSLLVKVLDRTRGLALLKQREFLGKQVTVRPADRLNTVEAIAHAPRL